MTSFVKRQWQANKSQQKAEPFLTMPVQRYETKYQITYLT